MIACQLIWAWISLIGLKELSTVQKLYLGLGHLVNDFVVFEHANVKVLGSDNQLIYSVHIEVDQSQRAHVITGHL